MKFLKNTFRFIIFSPYSVDFRCYSVCSTVKKLSPQNCNQLSANIPLENSPYYFEDGFRNVYPFYYHYSNYVKGRWIKKKIIDIYRDEFALYSEEECKNRIRKGLVKINDKIVDENYIVKNKDLMTAKIHRHELQVLDCPINILFEDDNYFVVDKPPSIPVHPCGLYFNNSVLNILANEYKKLNLFIIYRLDRLTSGVLVFAKSSEKSREMHNDISIRNVDKEYICRVEGNFPEDTVICNKPIKQFHHKIGLNLVHSQGKVAFTEFKKLSYNGKSSVVLCKPHTGRTHQIRVHLQYLGYPIINDPLYNSTVFGSVKGKKGMVEKPISQLLEELLKEQSSEWGFEKLREGKSFPKEKSYLRYTIFKEFYMNQDLHKSDKNCCLITYDEDCYFCNKHNLEQHTLGMFLHARKYATENWSFEAPLPVWASEDWDVA